MVFPWRAHFLLPEFAELALYPLGWRLYEAPHNYMRHI